MDTVTIAAVLSSRSVHWFIKLQFIQIYRRFHTKGANNGGSQLWSRPKVSPFMMNINYMEFIIHVNVEKYINVYNP